MLTASSVSRGEGGSRWAEDVPDAVGRICDVAAYPVPFGFEGMISIFEVEQGFILISLPQDVKIVHLARF